MSKLEIHQIAVLNDNYVYLAHDTETGSTAVIDPAVGGPVLDALAAKGWKLTHILNTHHHNDHTGGNLELKQQTGSIIVGPKADAERIPGIDVEVSDGDTYQIGNATAKVFDVPGHTRGHNAYWFFESNALFSGDTLFSMGCGRLFEGTPAQMVNSLAKFMALPDQTWVFCAHEYTQSNGRFALSIEPENLALQNRMSEVDSLRIDGKPTVPSTIGIEKATNPFLRSSSAELQKTLGLEGGDLIDVFSETRKLKDNF
jgi:hydroxyacylglutathione hydrolase